MAPNTTTFTSRGRLSELIQEEISKHRLTDLIAAVRAHETRIAGHGLPPRSHDEALYRRTRRQLVGES